MEGKHQGAERVTYQRILVPLDGSTVAAQALPYARLFAHATGAGVKLFQAIPTLTDLMEYLSLTGYPQVGQPQERFKPVLTFDQWETVRTRMRDVAKEQLESTAAVLRQTGRSVETTVGEGDPAEAIVSEAGPSAQTLIAMTSHGRSGMSRWWLGSVADKVIRLATTPLLLVHAQEQNDLPDVASVRTIILPLDGSALAETAVSSAVILANTLQSRVKVLQAILPQARMGVSPEQPVAEEVQAEAVAYVRRVVDGLHNQGVVDAEPIVVSGDPASIILEVAQDSPDPIVVMSTHGRTGMGSWVIGSVTDKVMRHGTAPVLLVRP